MATVKAMAIPNAIVRATLKEMFPRKKVWLEYVVVMYL